LVEARGKSLTDASIYRAGVISEFRIGNVLSRAWTVFTDNFIIFFVVMLVASLPNLLVESLAITSTGANPWSFFWKLCVTVLFGAVLDTVGEAVTVYGVFQNLRGEPVRLGEALQKGLARFFPIVGVAAMAGLVITLGLAFFILPGLIVLVMWSVALPVCVLEGLGPVSSLGRSSALTKGHRWQIFGIVLLLTIANVLVSLVLDKLLTPLGFMTAAVGSLIWTSLWAAYYNSVLVMIYHDLRVTKEGVDVNQIAAVFD
jgi:hypothetical protein